MMLILLVTLFCILNKCISVPISEFYPFGSNSTIDLESTESTIILTNSASISLSTDCGLNTVAVLNISAGGKIDFLNDPDQGITEFPMSFMPLAIDLNFIESHTVYFLTQGGNFPTELSDKVFATFMESFRNHSQFTPVAYTTVTWTLNQSYGSSTDITLINTFQVFFATNGSSIIVAYLYADNQLQWGNATMDEYFSTGINVCTDSWTHPSNLSPELINDVVSGSNVNVPGLWMFLIVNSDLILPVPCSPGCSFETGTCTVPNTCSCIRGWEGDNCTTPACPDGCGNGNCNTPFMCTCNEGWLLDDCSVAVCQNSCMNGMCKTPNICTCNDGWENDNCTTPICSNACLNGTCVGPDECDCVNGYKGELCDVPICLGGSDCMGLCNVPGECICNDGFTGVLCDEEIPIPTDQETDAATASGLSDAAIGGIVGGIIGFVFILIALVFFIFCMLCCFYY